MVAPTAAKVAPPNKIPAHVTPVAITANKGTTSFFSTFFITLSVFSFIPQRYAIILYVQIIWIIFSSKFLGANIPIYISAAPGYFCPTFALYVNKTFILYKIIK